MPALPNKPKAAGDDRNLVTVDENYLAPGLEDQLRLFWEKNSRLVIAAVAAVVLVLLVNEGRKYLAAQHDEEVAAAYGTATTPAALTNFLAAHPDEPQAGLAQLRLADDAYNAGNYAAAHTAYEQAVVRLAAQPVGAPFAARARLGSAVASLLAGQTAEAADALKKIAADASLPRAVRAEAAYDLAVQAADAGRTDEVTILTRQIMTMDPNPNGPWVERLRSLQSRPAASAAPVVSAPAATPPKTDAAPTLVFPVPPAAPAK